MTYRLFFALGLLLNIGNIYAHPHEWMNIVVDPKFNSHNEITALEQTWMFDPLYAQILLEPVLQAPNNKAQRQGMKEIEQEVVHKLTHYNYYTYSETKFLDANNTSLFVEDGDLYFRFNLPLKTPQHKLNFKIYEPTYYVEMRYDDQKQQKQWSNGCKLSIKESTPSAEMVYAAYAIDINESGPNNLGQYFAQSSQLICPDL